MVFHYQCVVVAKFVNLCEFHTQVTAFCFVACNGHGRLYSSTHASYTLKVALFGYTSTFHHANVARFWSKLHDVFPESGIASRHHNTIVENNLVRLMLSSAALLGAVGLILYTATLMGSNGQVDSVCTMLYCSRAVGAASCELFGWNIYL